MFNPMQMLGNFMNSMPSAQNNNPMGMLGALFGGMSQYAQQSDDPRAQEMATRMAQIQPLMGMLGGAMGGGAPWAQEQRPEMPQDASGGSWAVNRPVGAEIAINRSLPGFAGPMAIPGAEHMAQAMNIMPEIQSISGLLRTLGGRGKQGMFGGGY